jgi:hypothetical protein
MLGGTAVPFRVVQAFGERTFSAPPARTAVGGAAAPPNKGMKLTRPEHIGALQLIPSVRRTQPATEEGECW